MILEYDERLAEQHQLQLERLRQAIMKAEPSVIYDGRFEQMIISPSSILDIARELIEHQATAPYQLNQTQ